MQKITADNRLAASTKVVPFWINPQWIELGWNFIP
jgi:hypothetical protein